MPDMLLPSRMLKKIGSVYPNAWHSMEVLRGLKGKPRDWPESVFLPMAAVHSLLAHWGPLTHVTEQHVAILSALGAWRVTQGIYRLEPEPVDLAQVPVEWLTRLPEWCCYLDLEGLGVPFPGPDDLQVLGAFVHPEHDGRSESPLPQSFHVLVADSDQGLIPLMLPLVAPTVGACVDALITPEFADSRVVVAQCLRQILSLVARLCSEETPLQSGALTGRQPPPVPVHTKKGARFNAPAEPRIWEVPTPRL